MAEMAHMLIRENNGTGSCGNAIKPAFGMCGCMWNVRLSKICLETR